MTVEAQIQTSSSRLSSPSSTLSIHCTPSRAQGTSSSLTSRLSIARHKVSELFRFLNFDRPEFLPRCALAVTLGEVASIEERIETWNDLLHSHTTTFGTSYKEATIFLFSSNRILTEILDDPCEYGFDEDDADIEGGEIWEDDLHLTTEVHEIIVDRLVEAIFSGSELELLKR